VRVPVTPHLTRIGASDVRDERGATAILVALLTVFLVGMSAFTIDLGASYVSNRNLQKAADAGALAGAQALTQYPGTCEQVRSNTAAVTAAHQAAIGIARKNYPDASWTEDGTRWSVACDPELRVLRVTFANSGVTPARFAPVFGGTDSIRTGRGSQATVDVAPGAGENVRPLALCSAAVGNTTPGQFVKVYYPGSGTRSPAQCPKPSSSGNWWTLDCPEERSGSTSTLADQIKNGCHERVSTIPGQANAHTPGALTVVLESACPSASLHSETCMSGDPGNLDAGQVALAWKYLVDTQKVSIFPVFCVTPQCSDDTVSGTGTNTVFPVYKLVGGVVCGYHFSKKEKYHSTTGQCAGNPYLAANDPDDTNANNYLVLRYISVRTSGSNSESTCALGSGCDGGLRRTRLTG
jgi:hypothetical protein